MIHVPELKNKTDNTNAWNKRTLVFLLISLELQIMPSVAATPVAKLNLLLMSCSHFASCDVTRSTPVCELFHLLQFCFTDCDIHNWWIACNGPHVRLAGANIRNWWISCSPPTLHPTRSSLVCLCIHLHCIQPGLPWSAPHVRLAGANLQVESCPGRVNFADMMLQFILTICQQCGIIRRILILAPDTTIPCSSIDPRT